MKNFNIIRVVTLLPFISAALFTQQLFAQQAVDLGEPTINNTKAGLLSGTNTSLESDYQSELDKWMLQAYEGDREAQFKVGALFTNNRFQTADMKQAVYWYKQAARQGHALAQYNLGHQYLTGTGVKRNEKEAMKWWLKAAEQDHSLAQFNIGRAYYLGIGLDKDHSQSKLWFRRAAKNNEPKSIDILTQLGWSADGVIAPRANAISSSTEKTILPDSLDKESLAKNTTEDGSVVDDEKINLIGIYTNPTKRPVLIAILDIRNELSVVSATPNWTQVVHPNGFPVWVHQDFIKKSDNIGIIVGNSINARSVPLITNGSIVGTLNDGETVSILDSRDGWYRVMSPRRFQAWVKTDDFNGNVTPKLQADSLGATNSEKIEHFNNLTDDDDWLFKQESERYTLQLGSFNNPVKINEFKKRKQFSGDNKLRSFTSPSKDIIRTYFIYGNYQSALEAKQNGDKIGEKSAWVRSFGKLQQSRCIAWKKQIPAPKELNKYCS